MLCRALFHLLTLRTSHTHVSCLNGMCRARFRHGDLRLLIMPTISCKPSRPAHAFSILLSRSLCFLASAPSSGDSSVVGTLGKVSSVSASGFSSGIGSVVGTSGKGSPLDFASDLLASKAFASASSSSCLNSALTASSSRYATLPPSMLLIS